MAILHVDTRRRPGRRAALLVAAVLALGVALLAELARTDLERPADQTAPHRSATGCCDARTDLHWSQAPMPSETAPSIAAHRSAVALQGDDPHGAQLYREALRDLDCEALARSDATGDRRVPEQAYQFDPSGALAARIEREERARREPCRLLGPHEYRQADALMHRAAQQGDRDAALFLLERDVRAAVERAATAREQDQPVDSRELAAALGQAQAMALAGQRDAMVFAGQLMQTGQAGPPDSVGAAAWNLVALELDLGRPVSQDDLDTSGVLSSLTDGEAKQARQQAESLRRACCQGVLLEHTR